MKRWNLETRFASPTKRLGTLVSVNQTTRCIYADDGMLMATSVGKMERMIEVLVEVAGRSGLCINISKCKSMIFRRGRRENVERIGEI